MQSVSPACPTLTTDNRVIPGNSRKGGRSLSMAPAPWAVRLAPLLAGEAQAACRGRDEVKAAILGRLGLHEETYRRRGRSPKGRLLAVVKASPSDGIPESRTLSGFSRRRPEAGFADPRGDAGRSSCLGPCAAEVSTPYTLEKERD
ncbi:hypothetical protein DR999_PMT21554 [Platysternon megacephalum]|uniref:Uncharacterized protein n=1 Tax=Platysternon megacephalum TaxID=55544 RepID=A0A4D9DKC0_9SAUR|nr:hypothetical protein DR999_PMT21554 [Platysternon megacephalum]